MKRELTKPITAPTRAAKSTGWDRQMRIASHSNRGPCFPISDQIVLVLEARWVFAAAMPGAMREPKTMKMRFGRPSRTLVLDVRYQRVPPRFTRGYGNVAIRRPPIHRHIFQGRSNYLTCI